MLLVFAVGILLRQWRHHTAPASDSWIPCYAHRTRSPTVMRNSPCSKDKSRLICAFSLPTVGSKLQRDVPLWWDKTVQSRPSNTKASRHSSWLHEPGPPKCSSGLSIALGASWVCQRIECTGQLRANTGPEGLSGNGVSTNWCLSKMILFTLHNGFFGCSCSWITC